MIHETLSPRVALIPLLTAGWILGAALPASGQERFDDPNAGKKAPTRVREARFAGAVGHVTEPRKKIPVLYDVDVVVCGGGISGTMAAVAAARQGARTVVIDRFGRLGGNMGPGMWCGGSLHLALIGRGDPDDEELINRMGMGGAPHEFHQRVIRARPGAEKMPAEIRKKLEEKHLNVRNYRLGYGAIGTPGYLVDSFVGSHVADRMMDEAGVTQILSAYVADPVMEGNRATGVFVETKSGRLAVKAKIVIDATGEADVCMRAGAKVVVHMSPSVGLYYLIGGVDWKKHNALPKARRAAMKRHLQLARKVGKCTVRAYSLRPGGAPGLARGRTGTSGRIDFSDVRGVTRMERGHRGAVFDLARQLRKKVPGFENSYLMLVSPYLNARGGRYLPGIRHVGGKDLQAQRKFDDVIYIYNDRRSQKNVEVPYGALVPQKVDGLIACGRSSVVYGPNFRARCNMLMNGQAAGIAAALCVRDGVQPKELQYRKLQKILVSLGCPVGEEKRLKELGLK